MCVCGGGDSPYQFLNYKLVIIIKKVKWCHQNIYGFLLTTKNTVLSNARPEVGNVTLQRSKNSFLCTGHVILMSMTSLFSRNVCFLSLHRDLTGFVGTPSMELKW